MTTAFGRLARWFHRQMPTHQQIEANRFTAPLARRGELFRFTRRSVPRGVAAGLFIGIFALVPGVQIVGSALLCVPFRGNIPLAVAMTFISNPLTTLLVILPLAVSIGNLFGFHADIATVTTLIDSGAGLAQWSVWIVSDTAPAIVLGLFVQAVVATVFGYFLAAGLWRLRIAGKARRRRDRPFDVDGGQAATLATGGVSNSNPGDSPGGDDPVDPDQGGCAAPGAPWHRPGHGRVA
ncbi:DUF2062 domain-containing protein [Novosphingobium sp. 1949]|uniref:DUF2062 domain-containing protein n=1 Tax=Novosphingobium organovorum TaxID=2930092 RepID=A0ABT0BB56_9SPHN|nr:DUF2062 domain-containing protein [Novosphingobium organovorum]MCJ2182290.1 DUF2062 domain-containing protein [Novosphingobium organovorum]